ncbi:MAG: LysM peptidoglycan-binding domain-containing protein [Ilumatobacter sp.]|uniref:LysM peptidoglycan-binding domain-containing protein n=1 Tax=Ilumatobacter sp. TaxID=1967498 RepID=UPI00262F478F|nr:LysM peptidoglycan-binding domain-containing protein [Ilumatobacter sp.]MDJ0771492.1 LysM peptidoglycan-binding domain-containing protein [Ilumatobacter sp.]
MTDDRDLDRRVEASLDHRAHQLHEPAGQLADVWRRVDRRRGRRRGVAVVGSVAVIAVSAAGLLALDRGNEDVPTTAALLDAADEADAAAGATTTGVPTVAPTTTFAVQLWQCTDAVTIQEDPAGHYFRSCFPVVDGRVGVTPTTIVPSTFEHVVEAGDSVFGIASQYGVDPVVLANFNSWDDGVEHPIFVGDVVLIPPEALPLTTQVPSSDVGPGTLVPIDCYGGTTTIAPPGYVCRKPADEILPWETGAQASTPPAPVTTSLTTAPGTTSVPVPEPDATTSVLTTEP